MFELRGVPLLLFHAWEMHADNLLREYVLATGPGYPYSMRDVATAKQARDTVGAAVADAELAAPVGTASVDVTVGMTHGLSLSDFSTLQAILEHGNTLARRGDFLTLPPLPEIVALRNWICGEAIEQATGRAATAWRLSVAEADMPPAQWAAAEQLPVDRAWLVADDHNRIIAASGPAGHLLDWSPEDLVGQRILAVIPPSLREAHVAAFARATLTGEYRLLGQELAVSAWTRTGQTVPITLMLQKHRGGGGRTVFVGWLDRREA